MVGHIASHMTSSGKKESTPAESTSKPPKTRVFSHRKSRRWHLRWTGKIQEKKCVATKPLNARVWIRLTSFGPQTQHSSCPLCAASVFAHPLVLSCCALRFQWCQCASLLESSDAFLYVSDVKQRVRPAMCNPCNLISCINSLSFSNSTQQAASSKQHLRKMFGFRGTSLEVGVTAQDRLCSQVFQNVLHNIF